MAKRNPPPGTQALKITLVPIGLNVILIYSVFSDHFFHQACCTFLKLAREDNYIQLRPSKIADEPFYVIKRPIFNTLWLVSGKCYETLFANPNTYRLGLSKEIS